MIAKFDFGPAKPEGRRQTRPVENFAIIYFYKRIYYERGLFSYRFSGTIAQVTVT